MHGKGKLLCFPSDLIVTETIDCMIVYHAHSLHKCVTDFWAYELEAPPFQITAEPY